MSNLRKLYALHDSREDSRGMFEIQIAEAHSLNRDGFGIFHTVNFFKGPRRISNLAKVVAWAIDMDEGTKEEQLERLHQGLVPTVVVESKRGFHAYWKAQDGSQANWNRIMSDHLIPFYRADKKARDLTRVLRVPGFYHMKDPANPFLIQKIYSRRVEYEEKQIMAFYPDANEENRSEFVRQQVKDHSPTGIGSDLWESVYRMDCADALERLSGTEAVGGEIFTFRENRSGTRNIFVNGKSTSCWIDREGRIGSLDNGGPTIFNWLNYYHRNPSRVVAIMREHFKELPWTT